MAVLSRASADLDVVNTTAETDIFSFSVPGGTLSTNKMLRLRIYADWVNGGASSASGTFRVQYGSHTFYQDSAASQSGGQTARRSTYIDLYICAQGATNDQNGGGLFVVSNPPVPTTGTGNLVNTLSTGNAIRFADGAIDSTVAQTLSVSWQWSVADPLTSFKRRFALLETVDALSQTETLLNVVNTAAETTLFSFTVPANTLSTNKMLRFVLIGDALNNSGATISGTLRYKFGGQTLYASSDAFSSNGNRRSAFHAMHLCAQSASAQVGAGIGVGGGTAPATTGIGNIALGWNNQDGSALGLAAGTVDSTVDQLFEVTWQWASASVNSSYRRHYANITLV